MITCPVCDGIIPEGCPACNGAGAVLTTGYMAVIVPEGIARKIHKLGYDSLTPRERNTVYHCYDEAIAAYDFDREEELDQDFALV